jgi:sialate O-acetylesterase
MIRKIACIALLSILAGRQGQADVRLPAVFGTDMVLQQQRPVPVWGWADAGEEVTVTLGDQQLSTQADDQGRWRVTLAALPAGGPHRLTVQGNNEVILENVLVGEVWVCSGQSNMEWPVRAVDNAEQEIAEADYPQIRQLAIPHQIAQNPQEDCQGSWSVCSPDTVAGYTAVGYFFGRHLHRELQVPIGLINTSWGGTLAEAWTSREGLAVDPDFRPIFVRSEDFQPRSPHQASVLYNGMVHPLIPLAIRGAIWYKGESNVSRAEQYAELFPALIDDWREKWGQGDFPFLYVQLAPFRYGNQDPQACAELWEAQLRTLRVPNTGMAVINDIGNTQDIHPRNKQDVGKRLALWALAETYGQQVDYSGPLYDYPTVEGNRIRIHFRHAEQGLSTRDDQPPSHLEIAGADRKFLPAKAEIDGATLVVSHPEITDPVAVRFAWRDDAEPNLTDTSGLPASPFRTDDFPMVTAGRQ